jgi:hypothetical protein
MAFQQLTDDDLAEAVGETEREIFSESTGSESPEDQDFTDELIEEMSRIDDWAGRPVSDIRLAAESTGETPIGMSMGEVDGEDVEALQAEAYQQGAAAAMRDVAHLLPKAERPDMFADPEGWEANVLAQARGQGVPPPPHGYGQGAAKPDMFADPEGYERYLVNEIGRRAGIDRFNTDRINSSMGYAHKLYGAEFERAFEDLTQGLDASNPQHRQLINDVVTSPDPGMALMGVANLARAANANSLRYGSPHGANPVFAPGLLPKREPLRNSEGLAPRSREEAQELDVFRDAVSDLWSGF